MDYRDSTFEDVPTRIPLEKCTRYDGIVIYKPEELIHRKLQTMVGPNARYKPRDIYDAGWVATTHPELVRDDDARKLKNWIASRTQKQVQDIKTALAEDQVTGQIDTNELWECVARGINRLGTRDDPDDRPRGLPETPPPAPAPAAEAAHRANKRRHDGPSR